MIKTVKSTIGLVAACITAAAIADGGNVVSFEKKVEAKDPAAASAGTYVASSAAERLEDACYVAALDAKIGKYLQTANARMRSGEALAADKSTTLRGMSAGGTFTANKMEKVEPLRMPSVNENEIVFSKQLDVRSGDGGFNRVAREDPSMTANMIELAFTKAPDALSK